MKESVKAIIVPHDAVEHSGTVAGSVYGKLEWDEFDSILILCPLHIMDPRLILPNFNEILATPENKMIHQEWKNKLLTMEGFEKDELENTSFYEEQSFEKQLPFILTQSKDGADVLPILVGSYPDLEGAADILVDNIIEDRTLIIVTTDFTYYGPNYDYQPAAFADDPKRFILKKDMDDFRVIMENDYETLKKDDKCSSICGKNALLLWMYIRERLEKKLGQPMFPMLVNYKTCADAERVHPNFLSRSYAGITFALEELDNDTEMEEITRFKIMRIEMEKRLNNKEAINMLEFTGGDLLQVPRIAMMILEKLYFDKKLVRPLDFNKILNAILGCIDLESTNRYKRPGIYITFEEGGKTQGSMGSFFESTNKHKNNLVELMIYHTLQAIFSDDRYDDCPLRDLRNFQYLYSGNNYNFRTSYLDETARLADNEDFWDFFEPGSHGVLMRYDKRAATFLPSEMIKRGWIHEKNIDMPEEYRDKFEEDLFSHLLMKMGLDVEWSEWKNCVVYLYRTNEFDETDREAFLEYVAQDLISPKKKTLAEAAEEADQAEKEEEEAKLARAARAALLAKLEKEALQAARGGKKGADEDGPQDNDSDSDHDSNAPSKAKGKSPEEDKIDENDPSIEYVRKETVVEQANATRAARIAKVAKVSQAAKGGPAAKKSLKQKADVTTTVPATKAVKTNTAKKGKQVAPVTRATAKSAGAAAFVPGQGAQVPVTAPAPVTVTAPVTPAPKKPGRPKKNQAPVKTA